MSIPNKIIGELSSEFMSRCMSDSFMLEKYPNSDQRMAVCAVKERKDRESFDGK